MATSGQIAVAPERIDNAVGRLRALADEAAGVRPSLTFEASSGGGADALMALGQEMDAYAQALSAAIGRTADFLASARDEFVTMDEEVGRQMGGE